MQLALLFLPLLITGTALGEAGWEEDEEYEEEEDDSQFAEVIAETNTSLIRLSFKQKINLGCLQLHMHVSSDIQTRPYSKKCSFVYFRTS